MKQDLNGGTQRKKRGGKHKLSRRERAQITDWTRAYKEGKNKEYKQSQDMPIEFN